MNIVTGKYCVSFCELQLNVHGRRTVSQGHAKIMYVCAPLGMAEVTAMIVSFTPSCQ